MTRCFLVSDQDFVALDPVQVELRFEMEMSLNKRYIFKRGEHVIQDMRDGNTVPILPVAYQPKRKKPRSVFTLIDANCIPEGTVLEFRPQTKSQKKVMATWLENNPDYRWATWVNDRAKPLLCAADGIQYAVTDLTLRLLH